VSTEAAIRLAIFAAFFAAVALAESLAPRRIPTQRRAARWRTNLGILLIDVAVQRLTIGAAAYGAAVWAQATGFGLFNRLDWPPLLEGAIAFLALDFAVYLQHVASHVWPWLWRLHQVHHADLDVDLTTGIRFHPGEILLSLVYKAAVVAVLGADPWAVLAFEAVLNASAIYTHGNVRLPERLDSALRLLVCTPDMHRIHHSTIREETDSNYGFFLSVWDRLCRTMRRVPAAGHESMRIGLDEHRDPGRLRLRDLILMPLRSGRG
jgi:sterol desaturase/sphingolipid hydroxylase (fatty acid hydroxylase superfamily)